MAFNFLPFVGPLIEGIFGQKQEKKSEAFERQRIQMTATDAKAAGIHPLAAIGAASGYTNPFQGSSPTGSAIGDGIAASRTSKLDSRQAKLIDAQILESQSRTILNQANAKRALPSPGLGGGPLTAFSTPRDGGTGRGVRTEPEADLSGVQSVNLGKFTGWGPSSEAFEVGISEIVAGAAIYGPQWVAKALAALYRNTKAANSDRTTTIRRPRRRQPLYQR